MSNQENAKNLINDILKDISNLLIKAEGIADESGVDFYFSGPGYGMGGHYTPEPRKLSKEEKLAEVKKKLEVAISNNSNNVDILREELMELAEELQDDRYWNNSACYEPDYGWQASSHSC